jgi:flagellar motility protein MotE (MotC chaperone)
LFVIGVLVLDIAVAGVLLVGALPSTVALAEDPGPEPAAEPALEADALRLLGLELAARAAELDRREAELEELMRGALVLELATPAEPPAPPPPTTSAPEPSEPARSDAFKRLQRAYENMEPESAAKALAELASRDRDAVVELLLGWPPRTSGAILDALTQNDAGLAADLSYEVWKRSGNVAARAASSGQPQGTASAE